MPERCKYARYFVKDVGIYVKRVPENIPMPEHLNVSIECQNMCHVADEVSGMRVECRH